jgi:hypothetical protein
VLLPNLACHFKRQRDIMPLRALAAASKQDYQGFPTPYKVDAVSWTVINP